MQLTVGMQAEWPCTGMDSLDAQCFGHVRLMPSLRYSLDRQADAIETQACCCSVCRQCSVTVSDNMLHCSTQLSAFKSTVA